FVERQPYSGELYQDIRIKAATLPATDPGSIVAWEFEQRERPYLTGDESHFQEMLPVKLARFTIVLPPSWEFKNSWVQHADVKPTQAGGSWTWALHDLPGV